jgi:intracellular sulfur oxidation DsrE/DsrF family protein
MTKDDDLCLNAYIDGELSPDQQAELIEAMQRDPQLARRACELENLRKQVRLAYADPPPPARPSAGRQRWHAGRWAAGFLLVALGGLIGWLANEPPSQPGRLVLLDSAGRGQAPAAADSPETRIVFHLTDPAQTVAGELLDEVERLLISFEEEGRPLRVEVISHGEGLGLLRERLSAHKARIRALARRFDNLTFVACLNTMERLRSEQGIEVQLVPEAEVTRSGVSRVVRRQREGWAYIRV